VNVLKCILVQKVGFFKYTRFLHGNKMKITLIYIYIYLSLFAAGTLAVASLSPIRSQTEMVVCLRRIQNDRENETRNVH